jgi:hypothetical protein
VGRSVDRRYHPNCGVRVQRLWWLDGLVARMDMRHVGLEGRGYLQNGEATPVSTTPTAVTLAITHVSRLDARGQRHHLAGSSNA